MKLPGIELCIIPVVMKIFAEIQDSQIYTDPLTKLYNRRRMAEIINDELPLCSEENPLTLIMVDLDYFKSINDILGHDEGDKALTAFAKALRKSVISKEATAARWGGDEFVVATKEKELPAVLRELLNTALEKSRLAYTPLFSIGSYTCTSPDTTLEEAMVKADEELYKEKEVRHKDSPDFINQLKTLKSESSI